MLVFFGQYSEKYQFWTEMSLGKQLSTSPTITIPFDIPFHITTELSSLPSPSGIRASRLWLCSRFYAVSNSETVESSVSQLTQPRCSASKFTVLQRKRLCLWLLPAYSRPKKGTLHPFMHPLWVFTMWSWEGNGSRVKTLFGWLSG